MYRLSLDDKIKAANKLGLSYGYYVALVYEPAQKAMVLPSLPPQKPHRGHKPHFTNEQAFALWQTGMSDTAIGEALGVSQQSINRWRAKLMIPSLTKNRINPTKYRLATLRDGTVIAMQIDEL